MIPTETLKKYGLSLIAFIAIVLFFDGVYGGIGGLPIIEEWWASITIGLTMLALSGFVYKLSEPLDSIEEIASSALHPLSDHPEKHNFSIIYMDKVAKKNLNLPLHNLIKVDAKSAIFKNELGQEIFIPLSRITHAMYKDKIHWQRKHKLE